MTDEAPMADEKTRFQFDFGGVKLELAGDRAFVEEMYQRVMRDVERARQGVTRPAATGPDRPLNKSVNKPLKESPTKRPSVWVHRCSDMMRKIYMASQADVRASYLGEVLDGGRLETIYLDREAFNHFFPELEDGYTLWAEFTAMGRQKIADATRPNITALKK